MRCTTVYVYIFLNAKHLWWIHNMNIIWSMWVGFCSEGWSWESLITQSLCVDLFKDQIHALQCVITLLSLTVLQVKVDMKYLSMFVLFHGFVFACKLFTVMCLLKGHAETDLPNNINCKFIWILSDYRSDMHAVVVLCFCSYNNKNKTDYNFLKIVIWNQFTWMQSMTAHLWGDA